MKYRDVPNTDLNLSVVGFGCWAAGGKWWGDDVRDASSVAAMRRALDLGINWFDTAPLYGHGHADEVLVEALGPRLREVVVATKVGVRWDNEGVHATSDLTPAWVREDTENSLRRLGLERIDLLQVHWPCEKGTPIDDTLGELVRLRDEGKIRHFGLCNYDPETLARAATLAPIATLQTPYSMIRREFEHGLRDVCAPKSTPHLGVLAYEPLARGILTGKFRSMPTFPDSDLRARDDRFKGPSFLRIAAFAQALATAAAKVKLPTAALAIGWVCTRPGVTAAIAGAKTPEQITESARAAVLIDRPDFWRVLDPVVNGFRP